jgi:hypothetical protein
MEIWVAGMAIDVEQFSQDTYNKDRMELFKRLLLKMIVLINNPDRMYFTI